MKLLNRIKFLLKRYTLTKRVQKLRKSKLSDIERWSKDNVFHQNWNDRTKLLSDYILPNSSIIEFGAGSQVLETYLTNYKNYVPSDIVRRNERTVVCDLNQPLNIDLKPFDTVVFSGVLEYVYDLNNVFEYLKQNKVQQIVLSYCSTDFVSKDRQFHGWLSDYSEKELLEIFNSNGYQIKESKLWKNQKLYDLRFLNK